MSRACLMKRVVFLLVAAVLLAGCSRKSKYSHLTYLPLPEGVQITYGGAYANVTAQSVQLHRGSHIAGDEKQMVWKFFPQVSLQGLAFPAAKPLMEAAAFARITTLLMEYMYIFLAQFLHTF